MSERSAYVELLFSQYQTTIKGNVVQDILKSGELYFTALHDGKMTEADKEEIQNEVLLCAVRNNKNEY